MVIESDRLQTRAGSLIIRPAKVDELGDVMDILADAAAWLESKGVKQWPSPPNEHWWRRTETFIKNREMYLVQKESQTVATFRLAWTDPYWSDPQPVAGYIHTLAVKSHLRGLKIGADILDWWRAAIRDQNKAFARLDCQADNVRLRRYYEEQGFVFKRKAIDRDYVAALYEKRL